MGTTRSVPDPQAGTAKNMASKGTQKKNRSLPIRPLCQTARVPGFSVLCALEAGPSTARSIRLAIGVDEVSHNISHHIEL